MTGEQLPNSLDQAEELKTLPTNILPRGCWVVVVVWLRSGNKGARSETGPSTDGGARSETGPSKDGGVHSRLELVTDSAHGDQPARVGRVLLDLLAQVPHMHVDRAIAADVTVVAPDGLEELSARERPAGIVYKVA